MSWTALASRCRLPRAERERSILEVAERELARDGFRDVSMETIAQRSRITKALIYQYFDSKEGLYCACIERGRAQLFENARQAAASAVPRQQLAAIVDSYFDQLEATRNSCCVLYGDAPRRAVDEMRGRNAELLPSATSLCESDVRLTSQLIVGAGEHVGRWWLEHRQTSGEAVKARFTVAIGSAIAAMERR